MGVAIESLCTISLFALDERISDAQQSKIISLETRLAPRILDDAAKEKLSADVKSYAPQRFAFVVMPAPEAISLMLRLGEALESAGWEWVPNTETGMGYNFGGKPLAIIDFTAFDLSIALFPADIPKLQPAAAALQAAVAKAADLSASMLSIKPAPNEALPDMPETLLLIVGGKR